jgi:pimeloyl-ACP methyl ester carboxylesterase
LTWNSQIEINQQRSRTMIEDRHGYIDYEESGVGPTIVLVPGSCSTGSAWRPVMSHLGSGLRCVTTSLLGYGGTAERRTQINPDIAHEAEVLESVIRHANGPVHLVGHSFGGLIALAVALRKKVPLLSLGILEAPAQQILRSSNEYQHYSCFEEMKAGYLEAFHAGEAAAITGSIDFFAGPGTFASWPQRVRDYAVKTTAVNLLDWASADGFPLALASLSQINIPTLVVWGEKSHPAMKRANELLAQRLKAFAVSMPGASHFMISTHPAQLAHLLAQHVRRTHSPGTNALETSGTAA